MYSCCRASMCIYMVPIAKETSVIKLVNISDSLVLHKCDIPVFLQMTSSHFIPLLFWICLDLPHFVPNVFQLSTIYLFKEYVHHAYREHHMYLLLNVYFLFYCAHAVTCYSFQEYHTLHCTKNITCSCRGILC